MAKVDVSVILACYNEGTTFGKSVGKIVSVLEQTRKKWEIIFVEDKSGDDTKKSVEKLTSKIANSKAIYHQKNLGRGKSVSDGILASKGDICGYLDVDLEVSADYIPIFIEEIEKSSDVVVGRRFYEGTLKSIARFIASKTYATIVKFLLKIPIEDTEAGYKFFKRKIILPILKKTKDREWFWDTEICARSFWGGLKISQVPVLFIRRGDKKSTVRLVSDTWNYLTKIIKLRSQVPKEIGGLKLYGTN